MLNCFRCLKQKAPKDGKAQIKLLGEYDPKKELVIEDPYYVRKYLTVDTAMFSMSIKVTGTSLPPSF